MAKQVSVSGTIANTNPAGQPQPNVPATFMVRLLVQEFDATGMDKGAPKVTTKTVTVQPGETSGLIEASSYHVLQGGEYMDVQVDISRTDPQPTLIAQSQPERTVEQTVVGGQFTGFGISLA